MTETQEITWLIMNGVDLDSGKKPLRQRSPFIDVPMINCSDKARMVMITMPM